MSENVGTIFYEVDAQTDNLITAERKANKSLDDLQAGFGDTDRAAAKTQKTLDKTGSMMDGMGQKAGGLSAKLTPLAGAIAGLITVQTLTAMGKMAEQFTLLQSRIARLSPDIDTARASYQALLSIASTTGSTMADTTKLWESLTGTLKSLGATNAQVLTLTSTLQKIGTIGGSSAEETANALRQLGQGLAAGTLRAEEFNSIIEGMPELARQMAAGFGLSMGQLRQAMLDGKISSEALFEVLIGRTAEVDREFAKLPRTVAQASNAIQTQMGAALATIDQALGASQKLAKVLDGIARGVQLTFNPSDQQKLAQLLQDRATAQRQLQVQEEAGLRITAAGTQARLDGINKEIKALQDRKVAEIKSQSGTAATSKGPATTSSDGQKAIQALAEENQQLRAQGVERAKIVALQKLGANATQSEKDAAIALAVENFNLQEAEKKRQKDKQAGIAATRRAESDAAREKRKAETAARRAQEQERKGTEQNIQVFAKLGVELAGVNKTARELAQDQAALALNKYATPEQVESIRALAGALYDAKGAKAALAAADPIAAEQIGFQDQLTQLQDLNNQKLLSDQRYLELKGQAEREHAEQMRILQEENFKAASLGNEILMNSIDSLGQSGAQALSGLLAGTTSLQDAMGGIANTVLNAVIGSFVQMGVDWVKQQIMMQVATKATEATQIGGIAAVTTAQAGATTAIAATTTTTAATTGTAVASSMAPAAGLSSIASFGGAAVIGGAALLATMLLAKSFGGGRKAGGPVTPGTMYRVNEGGAPEVFNAGGQQYMIPNQRGEVVSNKDATGGGSAAGAAPVVNIYEASAGTSVKTTFNEADRRWVIDVINGDMNSGGKTGQTANRITGTQRAGR